ncbi:MAG: hypothetical protein OEX02_15440 [Cyclobacteriaceae bacterium]|nr:hypothetical protein [Cyclobacteriaceae bacterium]
MTVIKRISLINFILILTSCSGSKFKIEYFNSGAIKSKSEIKVIDGDTILEGESVTYYPNGKIYLREYYKNNILDSVSVWFYNNNENSIDLLQCVRDGKYFGSGFEYFENGIIKQYRYLNWEEEIVYYRKYNELGVLIDEEGHGIPLSYVDSFKYYMNDTIPITLGVVNPPGVDREFNLLINYEDGTFDKFAIPLENKTYLTFLGSLDKKGKATCIFNLNFKSENEVVSSYKKVVEFVIE